jgi:predicted Zn-ribbon and HTH transcriptional regulator
MSTFKKVKNSYTQEEVDRMLDEQASKTTAEMLEKFKGYKSRDEVIEHLKTMHINLYGVGISELEQVDNWIKENL